MSNAKDKLEQQLAELMEYNRLMLKCAEEGNWDKVVEQEIQLRQLMKIFYSIPDAKDLPDVADATREMLEINNKLQELASNAHSKVLADAEGLNKSRKAVDAYIKNTR